MIILKKCIAFSSLFLFLIFLSIFSFFIVFYAKNSSAILYWCFCLSRRTVKNNFIFFHPFGFRLLTFLLFLFKIVWGLYEWKFHWNDKIYTLNSLFSIFSGIIYSFLWSSTWNATLLQSLQQMVSVISTKFFI